MDGTSWIDRCGEEKRRRTGLARIVGMLSAWRERARQRHALAALDERALRDIGLTRSDQRRECDKPCWRA